MWTSRRLTPRRTGTSTSEKKANFKSAQKIQAILNHVETQQILKGEGILEKQVVGKDGVAV